MLGLIHWKLESRLDIDRARNVPGGAHPVPSERIESLCPAPELFRSGQANLPKSFTPRHLHQPVCSRPSTPHGRGSWGDSDNRPEGGIRCNSGAFACVTVPDQPPMAGKNHFPFGKLDLESSLDQESSPGARRRKSVHTRKTHPDQPLPCGPNALIPTGANPEDHNPTSIERLTVNDQK